MEMQLTYENVQAMISKAVREIVDAIGEPKEKSHDKIEYRTAYAKTEALLYSYRNFQKIVAERKQEIAEIREFGVPKNCGVTEFVQKGGLPHGIVLPEESVEDAVRAVQDSVRETVRVISLIDKCMAALRFDPYYKILEMRYFEGRTQEDIAAEFGCNQATIARNKSRLVKELAMRLFPDQVANEIMS